MIDSLPAQVSKEICEFDNLEVGFVWAIDYEIIREAERNGMSAPDLLALLLIPLTGVLSAHLGRHPHVCKAKMSKILAMRMGRRYYGATSCHTSERLLEIAIREPYGSELHVKSCPYCQREIEAIRAKLPHYAEFNV